MKRVIYKYECPVRQFSHRLHQGYEIKFVAAQNGVGMMWVLQDLSAPEVDVVFIVHGTGHSIADRDRHVGSWQAGAFVWHLFEVMS